MAVVDHRLSHRYHRTLTANSHVRGTLKGLVHSLHCCMWSQEPMTEQDNLRRPRRSLAQLARLRTLAEGRHVFHKYGNRLGIARA